MADVLSETLSVNPYESIVTSGTNEVTNLESQIQELIPVIEKLQRLSPTSTTLVQLQNRLAELQAKKNNAEKQNETAKSLMESYNSTKQDLSTLEGIYKLKQDVINNAKRENSEAYRQMYEDQKRAGTEYMNALGNATASENAIINANAGRAGASMQSTAEARATNYLNNAKQTNEAYANMISNLNAIEEGRLNALNSYTQLGLTDADNYLRQQVMNDYNERMQDKQMAASKSSGGYSSSTPNVKLPDTANNTNQKGDGINNTNNENWKDRLNKNGSVMGTLIETFADIENELNKKNV